MTRLPDAARSRAVLIGCSRYRHLEALPAVANNLASLRDALTDPALGGFVRDCCTVLEKPTVARDVFESLRGAAQQAEDTLLVYFCGHGLLGERNELHLALADAEHDFLPFTALAYDWVRAALAETRARNRIVILDCCFAGRAILDMADAQDGIIDQTKIEGTYILAAAPADKTALAPEGATYTAFTGVLLELLSAGIPGGPELLTLDVLFPLLRSTLASRRLPQPRRSGTDTVTGLALTRNPAHRPRLPVNRPTTHGAHPTRTHHDDLRHDAPVPDAPAQTPLLYPGDATGANIPPPETAHAGRGRHSRQPQPPPSHRSASRATDPSSNLPLTSPRRPTRFWRVTPARAAFLLLLPMVVGIGGFVVNALTHPGHIPKPTAGSTRPILTPTAGSTRPDLTPTAGSTGASPSGTGGGRLTSQVTASSGGLTLTVTRVAPADFDSTRIELTVQNDTATEMKLPLDFGVGNSTFRDDDGHWLPASDFFTGTEWPEIIPAHQSLKGAMGFERQFPARATKATLVLKFDVTDPSHRGPDGITVKDINLGPG